MSKLKYIILSVLCILCLFIPQGFVMASENTQQVDYHATATITSDNSLNVRSGPDKSYSILGQLSSGSSITIIGNQENGWYPIDYNGQTGYVYAKYVSEPVIIEEEAKDNTSLLDSLPSLSIVDESTLPLLMVGIAIILLLMLFTLFQVYKLTKDMYDCEGTQERTEITHKSRPIDANDEEDYDEEYDDDEYYDDDEFDD